MPVLTEELAHLRSDPRGKTGHRWQISCLEFSPDGSLLASGSWDKEVRIWDLSNLETQIILKGTHHIPVTSLSWHKPGGKLICIGSADCTADLWDSHNGSHLATLKEHDGWVLDVSFATTSSTLATASWDKIVRVWDSNTQSLVNTLAGHNKGVWSVDYKPVKGSTILCTGSEDGSLKLWDSRSNKAVRTFEGGHSEAVYCVRWSADGAMIASGSEDTKVCIWEPGSGALINTIHGHTSIVKSVCFNPQTVNVSLPVLASAGDYSIHLSDPRPGHKANILSLSPHETGKEIESVTISPDGSLLASGGRDGMIVLMTLMVPQLIPFSSRKGRGAIKKQREKRDISFIKDITHGQEEDRDDVLEDLDELDDILRTPTQKEAQQNVSRLKRISRTAIKEVELHDHHSTIKRNINAKTSRGRRVKEKNIDLPTMVAHLTNTSKSVPVYLEEADQSSSDEETNQDTIKAPSTINLENRGILERISKLKKEDMMSDTTSMSEETEIMKLKDNAMSETSEGTDDPESQFLEGKGLPHNSTLDSSLGLSSVDGHYSLLDHLNSSILLSGKQGMKGQKKHRRRPIKSIPESLSMSAISIGSSVAKEIDDDNFDESLTDEDDSISMID